MRNRELTEQALDLLEARRIETGNPNDLGDAIPFTLSWFPLPGHGTMI